MPLLALFIFIMLSWQAQAQSCVDIFNEIKKESMYCGFFCDQKILEPLQIIYEEKCVCLTTPLSSSDRQPSPQQTAVTGSRSFRTRVIIEPDDDTHRVDSSSKYYDSQSSAEPMCRRVD
jgi:hypothetical protein